MNNKMNNQIQKNKKMKMKIKMYFKVFKNGDEHFVIKLVANRHRALRYLEMFQNNRKEWKFNKNLQNYLINFWSNYNKLPKEHFKIFLRYCIEMKGNARKVIE